MKSEKFRATARVAPTLEKRRKKVGKRFAGMKNSRTFAALKGKRQIAKASGEMAEWSIAAVLKTVEGENFQGFESLSLRRSVASSMLKSNGTRL